MALIKHANARDIAREAIVLDLGDLSRQGRAIVEHARAQAEVLLAEARAERDRILAGAAERGREQGHAQGVEQGRRQGADEGRTAALAEHRHQLEQLELAWAAALAHFSAQRDAMLNDAHVDVLRLAAIVAGKVVKRQIAIDPGVVEDQLRAVLASVTRPTELALRIHPDDRPIAGDALPALLAAFESVRSAALLDDPSLARGSCVASVRGVGPDGLAGGEIDASIDSQLDRIVALLLPNEPAPATQIIAPPPPAEPAP